MEEILEAYCIKIGIPYDNGTSLEMETFCSESKEGTFICFFVDYQPVYMTKNKKTGAISLPDTFEFYVLTQGEIDEPTETRKPKVKAAILTSVNIVKMLERTGSVENIKIDPVKVLTDTKMTGTRVTGVYRSDSKLSIC